MVLIIDSHNPAQRIQAIQKLCQLLGFEAHVFNFVAQARAFRAVRPRLVLLHCGDQPDASQVLREWQDTCILAYYGGWAPNDDTAAYFANPSERHGLIPETVELGLELEAGAEERVRSGKKLHSDAIEKLKNCLELILQRAKYPPDAIQEVYGDPELEAILDGLYGKLVDGADLTVLRKDRDTALEEHYRKRRGW
jgi:hypothetical protein